MNATRICFVDGCDGKFVARDMCAKHYQRARKSENWTFVLREIDKFDELTDKRGECWLWLGNRNSNGYGRISIGGRRKEYVHRLAYERAHGPVPIDKVVDHKCRNRLCVRPGHLHAVTRAENNQNLSPRKSSTGVRGVSWNSARQSYQAKLQVDGKTCHVGRFQSLDEAKEAVVAARAALMSNSFD